MPELPEVEYARLSLQRWLVGRRLAKVAATAGPPLRRTTPRQVAALRGATLERVDRLGKHLLWTFDNGKAAHVHLGMTGKFVRRQPGEPSPTQSHLQFFPEGKGPQPEIHFRDPRRFGGFEIVPVGKLKELPQIRALGPDALTDLPDGKGLRQRLGKGRRPIKVVLLDQTLLAGLGNIQSVEVLYRARISPFLPANQLTDRQWVALSKGIRDSLRYALDTESPKKGKDIHYVEEGGENPFWVYGHKGKPCRRDGTPIARVVQAQRSTYYCPHCQPDPR